MKARVLKSILNNTQYIVHSSNEYIAIGSPLCSDLISVNKRSLHLKYTLDGYREGRKALVKKNYEELLFIWDKLQELIDNGQIIDIIRGVDILENPLPVYTVKEGKLIETTTDAYGWPNVTVSGELMYDNTYFNNRADAIQYGIKDVEAGLKMLDNRKAETEQGLIWINNQIIKENEDLKYLKSL